MENEEIGSRVYPLNNVSTGNTLRAEVDRVPTILERLAELESKLHGYIEHSENRFSEQQKQITELQRMIFG